jgi:hypothetical protein
MCLEMLVGVRHNLACYLWILNPNMKGGGGDGYFGTVRIPGRHDFVISCIIFSADYSAILLVTELCEVCSVLRMRGCASCFNETFRLS